MRILLSCMALTLLIFSSLWAILHPWGSQQFPKTLAKIALILGLILLIEWWMAPAATASVDFMKEAGQWIYQSQQVLLDTDRNAWNVTAFKQMDEGNKGFYLRVEAAQGRPADFLFDLETALSLMR